MNVTNYVSVDYTDEQIQKIQEVFQKYGLHSEHPIDYNNFISDLNCAVATITTSISYPGEWEALDMDGNLVTIYPNKNEDGTITHHCY